MALLEKRPKAPRQSTTRTATPSERRLVLLRHFAAADTGYGAEVDNCSGRYGSAWDQFYNQNYQLISREG